MNPRLTPLASALLLAISTPALADAAGAPQATELDAVEVHGERVVKPSSVKYTEPLLDTPQTITVVTREVMDQQALIGLRDVLSTLPGITFGAGEGGGGYGDKINLRGFDATADITVDGVRDSGLYTRSDNFNIEALELVNGANSAVSGAGSVGGNINLVAVAHARFDHHAAVAGADLHDPVHVRERNHHTAGEGHRRTGGAGAGATGDHRHPVLATGAHDRGDLVAVARQCHRVGQGGHVRIILAVGAAQRLAGEPAIGAEQGGQFNVQRRGQCVRHRSIVCRSWWAWPIPPAAPPVGRRVPRPGAGACPRAGRYTSSRRKASFIQLSCGAAGSPLASTTSKRHGRRARRGRGPR